MSEIVFAAADCVTGSSANRVRLRKDEAWFASDPFVVANPHLFNLRPAHVRGAPAADVEQATAAPGERRGGIRKSSLPGGGRG